MRDRKIIAIGISSRTANTSSAEAYQLYLKGIFHWNKRKADDLRKAVDYFNEAINLDPGFARAYAGLGFTYAILPEYAGVPFKDGSGWWNGRSRRRRAPPNLRRRSTTFGNYWIGRR